MITYPTLAVCEKAAMATGGNPVNAFGACVIDHIIWDSAGGALTWRTLLPGSWIETCGTTHVIAKLGENNMTPEEILGACHSYVETYLGG